MIKVWTDSQEAGMLDRSGERGSSFAYSPEAPSTRAVSVTMPVRLPSWDIRFGLPPIFEMNLPEGVLRERLRLAFAKATGTFDEFDLLGVVGRSQVGRVRYTGQREQLQEDVPFQSVDEILEQRRGGDLFHYLIEKFATFSGISGVQPKILVRDEAASSALHDSGHRFSESYRGATHIVKFWEQNEYPQLAANEYFCLEVAKACGLEVPSFRLSEDALALVIDRFDLRSDGTYRGFEDFCVLNARRTDEKYRGSYETSVMKRFTQFANSPHLVEDTERLFTLIALNCALRNGDAHLKNFGIVYNDVQGEARLAPVYDLVTTSVYLPKDSMALTLNGSTRWPSVKDLQRLGETRMGGSPARITAILERIADAMSGVASTIRQYIKTRPEFGQVGSLMLAQWQVGIASSIRERA
ncbi:type II toxin-antitoxin system HipA family toxin [Tunturiibacter gelidoferens]|uniref:Serine/threonine-protein kinase HipA n=1 Tax=Tunturiibacter lichenicola TaxID=2051959 RepID=A0A7Y9NKK8_9BACT|nr:type II toxin-antitoxin system HipA family toxin [Edaphobacter lichenicola]NYF51069.1 serine/threonine-protein kinase HipA [Edaphobacter lichenicola]